MRKAGCTMLLRVTTQLPAGAGAVCISGTCSTSWPLCPLLVPAREWFRSFAHHQAAALKPGCRGAVQYVAILSGCQSVTVLRE